MNNEGMSRKEEIKGILEKIGVAVAMETEMKEKETGTMKDYGIKYVGIPKATLKESILSLIEKRKKPDEYAFFKNLYEEIKKMDQE